LQLLLYYIQKLLCHMRIYSGYIHPYIHTYVHTCMHVFIHTYTYIYMYLLVSLLKISAICLDLKLISSFFVLFALGGTFALYSLLCRHAKVGLLPNKQAIDEELSTYSRERPRTSHRSPMIESLFEKHQWLRSGLLIVVLLGTCMVIGDGVLTPTISGIHLVLLYSYYIIQARNLWANSLRLLFSPFLFDSLVLSAVSGLKVKAKDLHERKCVFNWPWSAFDIILWEDLGL
jgi:hypothetical protein